MELQIESNNWLRTIRNLLFIIAILSGVFLFAKTFKKTRQKNCQHAWIYIGSETFTRQHDHREITRDDYKCTKCGLIKSEIK